MLIQFSPLHKHQLFGQCIQIPFEKKNKKQTSYIIRNLKFWNKQFGIFIIAE